MPMAMMVSLSQAQPASGSPTSGSASSPDPLTVYAAVSLRTALTAVAKDFEDATGTRVRFVFGASGLLRDRLEKGEAADVFASANTEHPRALHASGKAQPARAFARNALCALAAPTFDLRGKTLAQRMLDDDVKLGTSTPKADPSGDYAFEMFDRIEHTGAAPVGSAVRLKAKALQLTGGPQSPPPPPDRNAYGVLVAEGKADVFITYCTSAVAAAREHPSQRVLPVPDSINVTADYGLTILGSAAPGAARFVDFLIGGQGQRRMTEHGFRPPT